MAVDPFQLGLAMGLSLILIAIIIACAALIDRYGRKSAKERAALPPLSLDNLIEQGKHFILLRVLLDKNGHASLSAFQFLAWTLVLSILYVSLWFLQLLNGSTQAPPPIPESLMALMGISVAIPIASQGIVSYKRSKPREEADTYIEPNYASMLEENGRPSLLRLQMFLWTLVAIVIFTGLFFASAYSPNTCIANTCSPDTDTIPLGLPEIDQTLLFLMGLSATGYLANQAYSGKVEKAKEPVKPQQPGQPVAAVSGPVPVRLSPGIREIIPQDVKPNTVVTLLGSGFGAHSDMIMIGEDQVPPAAIRRWEETRIEFTLPENISPGTHNLRVLSGGEAVNGQISVSVPQRLNDIDANIVSDIWIDDPSQKWYRLPPIGYFIPDRRYSFFYEFEVPPGTPRWGRTQFRAKFFIDGKLVDIHSFLPGAMDGQNIGWFEYTFTDEGKYHIEIMGLNTRSMDIEVKKPPG